MNLELQRRTSVVTIEIQGVRKLEVVTVRKTASQSAASTTSAERLSSDGEPETVYFCDEYCFDDFIDESAVDDESEASQSEIDDALSWLAAVDFVIAQAAAEAEAEYLGGDHMPTMYSTTAGRSWSSRSPVDCVVSAEPARLSANEEGCGSEWFGLTVAVVGASGYIASYGAELTGGPVVAAAARITRKALWQGRANMIVLAGAVVSTSIDLKRCIDRNRSPLPTDWHVESVV